MLVNNSSCTSENLVLIIKVIEQISLIPRSIFMHQKAAQRLNTLDGGYVGVQLSMDVIPHMQSNPVQRSNSVQRSKTPCSCPTPCSPQCSPMYIMLLGTVTYKYNLFTSKLVIVRSDRPGPFS